MNRFAKIGACLLAFVLFAYLLLVDYPRFKESLTTGSRSAASEQLEAADSSAPEAETEDPGVDTSADTSAEVSDPEASETAALQAQAEALEQELEDLREQCGAVPVALFFDQSTDVIYQELYPAMTTAGYTGTIVFQDGALTGNYQIIETSEFKTMNEAGWEYAIGGDSTDIDLTGTVTAQAWQTSLETYIKNLRARTGITPTLYVFRDGEYQEDCDAALEDLGYTALAYSAADAAEDTAVSALTRLTWFRVSAETDAETLLEELQSCSCAVLLAEVDEADSTGEDLFTSEDYIALLGELVADDGVTITTGTEILETAADGSERQQLLEQIQEKEAELAQVQAQLE
ncbi:MAG: polysaccharide deacetylase family protein [Clostridiales bacterium]|nr:polysaccharide deacetylase family protein [Clostridiales bacterium]